MKPVFVKCRVPSLCKSYLFGLVQRWHPNPKAMSLLKFLSRADDNSSGVAQPRFSRAQPACDQFVCDSH